MLICEGPDVIAEECGHWFSPDAVEKLILAEREACAKVCEEEICTCCWDDQAQSAAEHLADAIRARSKT